MGCSLSKKNRRKDSNPRVFNVINFDNHGQERNPGKIEITETHLVLTQRGKDAIRWPLNSLRRYGYEEELFSFESGRKSPTGVGIYAFKCRRAEALFNLLQDCIQRAGQEEQRLPLPLGTDNASRPTSLVDLPLRDHPLVAPVDTHIYVNGLNPIDAEHHPLSHLNPATLANRSHEYVNYNLNPAPSGIADPQNVLLVNGNQASQANAEPAIQYAELLHNEELLERSNGHVSNGALDASESSQPVYINVPAGASEIKVASPSIGGNKQNGKPPMLHKQVVSAEAPRDYANVTLGPSNITLGPSNKPSAPGMKQVPALPVLYAELDLANSIDSVTGGTQVVAEGGAIPAVPASPTSHTSSPESPTKAQQTAADRAYATIDFDRTKAMQDARLTNNDRTDGPRKTRHNSNVEELYT